MLAHQLATEADMPKRKGLTDRQISALPRKAKRYIVADPEQRGLYLRIPPDGPITFTVVARAPGGRQIWAAVGTTAETEIARARTKAREALSRIKQGKPPIEPPKPAPDSVAVVAENWLRRHVENNKLRSARELRWIIDRLILPHVGNRVFTELKRSDIAELLDVVEEEHKASTADHVFSTLRSIASWVQKRDDDYASPFVRGMRRVTKDQHSRARILSDDEIRKLWADTEDTGPAGAVLRIALLTAQRKSKIMGMRWQDLSGDIWTIRTEAREKGNAGALKLPKAALDLIKKQPRYAGDERVFHLGATKLFESNAAIGGWRIHDLRRTARSLMSRAGVQSEHAERVMGHVIRGVEGTYDRYSYDAEKAMALEKLTALVERIVNPSADNIVALARG
jgi:integrase